jgi:hypothetical protein
VLVGGPVGELVGVELAEHDRACLSVAGDDGSILGGDEVLEHPRTGGGPHAPGPVKILVADGDAVERAAVLAAPDRRFRLARRGEGLLLGERHERVHLVVVGADAIEVALRRLDGGDFLLPDSRTPSVGR